MQAASRSTAAEPALPAAVRPVREVRAEAGWVHPEWAAELPWLAQGTTGRDAPGDMGFFGASPVAETLGRWRALRDRTGIPRAVHARQVHGARIAVHEAGPPGIHILDDTDGHATVTPGVLLTVSVADCVPVALVDPDHRRIALLHAGWRGAAAGMLETGVAVLARLGSRASELRAHLGPAICGPCYEVGPEVLAALALPASGPARLDLRAFLAGRALAAGIDANALSVSTHCTRCGDAFFSHRGGEAGRQVGYLGIRSDG